MGLIFFFFFFSHKEMEEKEKLSGQKRKSDSLKDDYGQVMKNFLPKQMEIIESEYDDFITSLLKLIFKRM
jgi:hypothetical protein